MILPVKTSTGAYDIVLERGALSRTREYLPNTGKALIVTDNGVPTEYAKAVAEACEQSVIITLPKGEATKNLENHRFLLSKMLEAGFTRSDRVIAVGGGVMGDLAGFAAAVYMRGIDFYNVPTTLLSQVDSSIGGKVAVDMDGVKNVVGAFYPPRKVIIDPDVLQTLPMRQVAAGLAEGIKMAVTCDAALFEKMEQSDDLNRDLDAFIEGSLRIKRSVVEEDPCEKGLRRVLNFGHTIGHAIESTMNGQWLHGECVAAGMLPMCGESVRKRLERVLLKYNLPIEAPCPTQSLISYMEHDKKAVSGGVIAVLSNAIGTFEFKKMSVCEITERMKA